MVKEISIIGVPMDLGQLRRGVDMGPSAIRYAGIVERLERLNYTIYDLGNIDVPQVNEPFNNSEEQIKLRNLKEVVQTNNSLAKKVDEQVSLGRFPLVLGGDHS